MLDDESVAVGYLGYFCFHWFFFCVGCLSELFDCDILVERMDPGAFRNRSGYDVAGHGSGIDSVLLCNSESMDSRAFPDTFEVYGPEASLSVIFAWLLQCSA